MNANRRAAPSTVASASIAICMFALALTSCQGPYPRADYSPCSPLVAESGWQPPGVHTGDTQFAFDVLADRLEKSRVILIGELHDRYDHHLTQLELICQLHARDGKIAIGVEFVQQPFQATLDDYVQDRLDEDEFLRQSEYFNRWGFDYRLYAPIMRFANTQAIPVIALNVPGEMTAKIAREGLETLTETERQFVPASGLSADETYRTRLEAVFAAHAGKSSGEFDNFLKAQLLWDEGMAERAVRYLEENPGGRMIVIAGNGHVAYRNAIADRIAARHPARVTIISQDSPTGTDADYVLQSTELSLPLPGRLGVLLDSAKEGVRVESFTADSAALAAGIKAGDLINSLNGRPTLSFIDVKLTLWRKVAGDSVSVGITRNGEQQIYQITLK